MTTRENLEIIDNKGLRLSKSIVTSFGQRNSGHGADPLLPTDLLEVNEGDFEGSTKSDELPSLNKKKNLLKTTLLHQCKQMCSRPEPPTLFFFDKLFVKILSRLQQW